MKFTPAVGTLLNCSNSNEVFDHLTATLSDTITYWDYFVNWDKVLKNVAEVEMDLHLLDYLVGKQDVESAFADLLRQHPQIVRLLPVLLAIRNNEPRKKQGAHEIHVLVSLDDPRLAFETYDFAPTPMNDARIQKTVEFARNTKLLDLFQNRKIRNVADYVIGIEVGLDSNGRKNRGGQAMERLVESRIALTTKHLGLPYLKQATARAIASDWEVDVAVDKSSRSFDFAVQRKDGTLCLIETNYYGGGGSKLKATAGEYRTLHDWLVRQGHELVWITDGQGWRTTLRPLREAFDHLDHVMNLRMVAEGYLQHVLGDTPRRPKEP